MGIYSGHTDPASASTPTHAFSRTGGPLVAVAGLVGGAGASTLAHLLAAAAAAASSSAPILLAETGGSRASLGLLAGVSSPGSLDQVARDVDAGRRSEGPPFAVTVDGLRVIAGGPCLESRDGNDESIELVLDDARAAHGLTVVDCCSIDRVVDQIVLTRATHVVWVAPAATSASVRAAAVLDDAELPITARELLAVRLDDDVDTPPAPPRAWSEIARRRDADVVLVPRIPRIDSLPLADRLDEVALALRAIVGALK